ncbi:hypothetical protein Micbo1qcDRAFT_197027 [Microdochium bolleyi]|uniref:Apple domain-containing protein n=1 Tax=Microdochium bolleyi TaxID=196109 RepID=A0A136IWB4_9PEZI|nr:hypothetical protein Micbo1qcDRAFT_197027 [Microdochium bolleyi]
MRSHFLLAALAATVAAVDDGPAVEVPDALDTAYLKSLPEPEIVIVPGLAEQVVNYNADAAVATAAAAVSDAPLSVFPAQTADAINAAGDSPAQETGTPTRRQVVRGQLMVRAACDPEATNGNPYNIDASSYAAFKADPNIASVANAAATPAGYFQNFKNADGANSASAYLGYTLLSTGYDVALCAKKCTEKDGCLAFNIFFERSPVVNPGPGCENPLATANIKCSFWGVPLDPTTATNKGQWRDQFQVGIAGSTAYTSYSVGGPVDGYNGPASLNQASMQAPLRDCAGTWTYMGYKIYTNQPFDPRLCSAACDAQTEYNIAHPPASGKPSKCAAFGTYLVHKQTSSGSSITGQMCTMYTSDFAATYATNTGSTDADGTKWTFSNSFWYSKADRQPICTSSIDYLKTEGQEFCSSYISYSAPQATVSTTVTPAERIVATETSTTTVTTAGVNTVTGNAQWKRGLRFARQEVTPDSAPAPTPAPIASLATIDAVIETVDNLGPSTVAILTEYTTGAAPTNGTAPLARRAVPTPASVAGWAASRISEACSSVATGTATVVNTVFASQTTTTTVVATTTAGLSTCVVPSQLAEYKNLVPIWGRWDASKGTPGANPYGVRGGSAVVQLPFPLCLFGVCTSVIQVKTDGAFYFTNPNNHNEAITMNVYQGTDQYMYTGWPVGVYWRVTGAQGSRQLTLSWYAATFDWGHATMHVTATWYENAPGTVYYKYYDAVQVYRNNHGIQKVVLKGSSPYVRVWPASSFMTPGTQIKIVTQSDGTAVSMPSQRNRVNCCTDLAGWHSCTEWQPQVL